MNYELVLIIMAMSIAAISLLALNDYILHIGNHLSLSFNDGSLIESIFDGKITIIITNDMKTNDNILHLQPIYGQSDIILSSSNMFGDKYNSIITSDQIKFDGNDSVSLKRLTSTSPRDVMVHVISSKPGIYHGNLEIVSNGNKTSVPITVDISPDFLNIAVLVIDGIAISVGTLNLIGYYFLSKTQRDTGENTKKIIDYVQNNYQANARKVIPYVARIISKLELSKPNAARRELSKLNSYVYQMESNRDSIQNVNTIKGRQDLEGLRLLREETEKPAIREFRVRGYASPGIVQKNVISAITGVAFGIIVGFIPLTESDYIANLRQIEITDIIILVGLGIGIGNLNEAIAKVWEKAKEEEEDTEDNKIADLTISKANSLKSRMKIN